MTITISKAELDAMSDEQFMDLMATYARGIAEQLNEQLILRGYEDVNTNHRTN